MSPPDSIEGVHSFDEQVKVERGDKDSWHAIKLPVRAWSQILLLLQLGTGFQVGQQSILYSESFILKPFPIAIFIIFDMMEFKVKVKLLFVLQVRYKINDISTTYQIPYFTVTEYLGTLRVVLARKEAT